MQGNEPSTFTQELAQLFEKYKHQTGIDSIVRDYLMNTIMDGFAELITKITKATETEEDNTNTKTLN